MIRFFLSGIFLGLFVVGCQTKPTVPPRASEFRNSFYSLNQSGIVEYRCHIIPLTVAELSDSEINYFFKENFHREASLQERGMLKGLRWTLINSNEKQEAIPNTRIREFPTNESADIAEKLTYFLNLINKVLTLTYLENFADRPDLKTVAIGEKFFTVVSTLDEVAAEVEFNKQKYRIFYGEKPEALEVSLQPLGSMQIPKEIVITAPLTKKSEKISGPEKIAVTFELFEGVPRLKTFNAISKQFNGFPVRFLAENCQFTKQ